MNTHLNQDQIATFHEQGFLAPLRAFTQDEAAALRAALEAIEQESEARDMATGRFGLPLTTQWAWDLVHDPRIVDPISDVLGPNVLLWSMDWFIKEPGPAFVSYHQDATYWGLEPHHVATAWIALSDARPATGPMKFIRGSHNGPLFEQQDTFEENNLLSRGQAVKTDVDETLAVMTPLKSGEMSLHHVRVIHGSEPNTTDDRRIGMALRYCATDVRQTKVKDDRAILVKGVDEYQHFGYIPRPTEDRGARELALAEALANTRQRALHSMDYED
jgi:non-heme Fe2+,alpha-ketoglutarate-dependent halogenase